ncbi:GIY-YIG nuclease family protein [Candidatus Parcubacteria bacterium]|nr:GIY-YIG nuclease family protein [Candidatus Parcubacteria bacterium]
MYYVYILKSKTTNWKYTGSCSDLKKRLKEHITGKVRSTKHYRPLKMIYYECFNNKKDATIEEHFLKTGKGKERLKFLLKNSEN